LGKGFVEIDGSRFDDNFDVSTSDVKVSIKAGFGDDILVAGSYGSELFGGSGNDTISGGGGNDTIDGGEGNDVTDGGDGEDTITVLSGYDTVHGGDGNDLIIGGGNDGIIQRNVSDTPTNGLFDGGNDNDVFKGFSGKSDVTLVGGAGDDVLQFQGNASHLHVTDIETLELQPRWQKDGEVTAPIITSVEFLNAFKHITSDPGTGAEIHLADGGTFRWRDPEDKLGGQIYASNEGNKIDLGRSRQGWTVTGSNRDDVITVGTSGEIYANGGNDRIIGGAEYDSIRGGGGNDTIDGRNGNDELQGDAGRDTFIFETGSGKDTIYEFDAASKAHDVIDLSAIHGISSYDDLLAHHISTGSGAALTISLDGGDKIYVYGLDKDHLDPSLFILAS